MIDIQTFLANRRRQVSAASVSDSQTSKTAPGLHRDLRLAAERGWLIEPVLSHSRFAFSKDSLASPTCDIEQITRFDRQYPRCNWLVETGRSSQLLILSVNRETGRDSLRRLCADDWDWRSTVQFRDDIFHFIAFRYSGQKLRFLDRRFEGLKAFARESILIPPSWFVTAHPLFYLNPVAKLLDVPDWLVDEESGLQNRLNGVRTLPTIGAEDLEDDSSDGSSDYAL